MARYVNADLAPIYLNKTACEQIEFMPTEDVVPVRHGMWVFDDYFVPHCSECGTEIAMDKISPFCPNCGAMMDEEC